MCIRDRSALLSGPRSFSSASFSSTGIFSSPWAWSVGRILVRLTGEGVRVSFDSFLRSGIRSSPEDRATAAGERCGRVLSFDGVRTISVHDALWSACSNSRNISRHFLAYHRAQNRQAWRSLVDTATSIEMIVGRVNHWQILCDR